MAKDLKEQIHSIRVLNLDEEESTMTQRQLLWNYDDHNKTSFIISDADPELLILIQFTSFVDLHSITLKALQTNNTIDMSQPRNIHIYSTTHSNINFDDIHSMKSNKSIVCYSKKLNKGQNISLNKTSKNVLNFNKIQHIAIFIQSNQNDTEKTFINGIKLKGIFEKQSIIAAKQLSEEMKVNFEENFANTRIIRLMNEDVINKPGKKFMFPNLTNNSDDIIEHDHKISTKFLIDGYMRSISNKQLYIIPHCINLLCLKFYHYTIDAILNYNHISMYQKQSMNCKFGKRWWIYKRKDEKLFAVKIIPKAWKHDVYFEECISDIWHAEMYENEINILMNLNINHPNILNIVDVFENNLEIYLFYNYCTGFGIWKRFEYADVKPVFRQLLSVLVYLHELSIVHRHICLQNIWWKSEQSAEIVLMGNEFLQIVPKYGDGLKGIVGHYSYMAPEMITEKYYDTQVDMWSCGVLLFYLLCRRLPFYANFGGRNEVQQMIINGQYDMSGPEWNNVSNDAKDLVRRLLKIDPHERLNALQTLSHSWFL